jgi:hypothetical protein
MCLAGAYCIGKLLAFEGLKMCYNCGKANSFPIQYAPARHMIVQPFVDIDLFTGVFFLSLITSPMLQCNQ